MCNKDLYEAFGEKLFNFKLFSFRYLEHSFGRPDLASELPLVPRVKASRMVKIEKEQILTVPLFLLYPVCYEIQYIVLNDDVGASKTMALASPRNGYLPD